LVEFLVTQESKEGQVDDDLVPLVHCNADNVETATTKMACSLHGMVCVDNVEGSLAAKWCNREKPPQMNLGRHACNAIQQPAPPQSQLSAMDVNPTATRSMVAKALEQPMHVIPYISGDLSLIGGTLAAINILEISKVIVWHLDPICLRLHSHHPTFTNTGIRSRSHRSGYCSVPGSGSTPGGDKTRARSVQEIIPRSNNRYRKARTGKSSSEQ